MLLQNTDTAVPSAWKSAVAEIYLASEPSVRDIPGPKCTISLSGCFCSTLALFCNLLAEPVRLFSLIVLETLLGFYLGWYCLRPRVCVLACISVTWL